MNPTQWKKIKETFSAVMELHAPGRDAFLAKADAEIRREVEKLLSVYEKAENFIETPVVVAKGLTKADCEANFTGKRIDDYVILKKIGEGGMGIVFLAEHCGADFTQRVALKLIKRGMDTTAVLKRFLMERQILATLEHPNIARLIDGGSTEDGLPYFVMEYVEGENIRQFCDNQKFDTKERLALFQKICQAISHAHQKLIVHRDIKPSNIIVTEAGEPKLLDFGIAKLLAPDWSAPGTEATLTQMRLLTPEYASPEQIRGKPTTTATDIYSLGVVLYELLTGTRPFDFKSKNPFEISEELSTREPLRPSSVVGHLPEVEKTRSPNAQNTDGNAPHRQSSITDPKSLKGDLDNIILKAIRRVPERRYQSVPEFCDDINRYLKGLPVKATADTRIYRLEKFIGRHRTAVLAAVLVGTLLLAAAGITTREYFTARSERAKAEQRFEELRGVAKSLLNETNDALERLPENLEIRKKIVEKSVAVLDKLANEDTNDPDFLSELADAYDKLGKIRHWKFHESGAALSDYEKARQFRRQAIRIAAQNVEIRKKLNATLGNILEVYAATGNQERLLEFWQTLRDNSLQILALEPENPLTLYELSVQTEQISTLLKDFGRGAESEEQMRQSFDFIEKSIVAHQAEPFSVGGQVTLVTFLMQKGNLLRKSKRPDEALAVYQTAAEIAEKTYRADTSLKFAFNHASRTHRLMADIFRERGDWQKFLENSEFSLNWMEQNLENKQLDARSLLGGKAFYLVRTGVALDKLGQSAGAAKVDEGYNLYRQLLKGSENDGENIIYAPEMLEMVSDFYVETNQTEKAVEVWQRYAAQIEPFVAKNSGDATSTGYLSYALERRADVLAKFRKDSETFAENDPSLLRQAQSNYLKAVALRQKILRSEATNQIQIKQEKTLSQKISRLQLIINQD